MDGQIDLLRRIDGGWGQIKLSTLLLGLAEQAITDGERSVLDQSCEAWFDGDYRSTLNAYRRLAKPPPVPPNLVRLRVRRAIPTLDDTALHSLLDRLRYSIKMRDVLDLIGGDGTPGDARDVLDRLCRHCFALDYRSALSAYWQLFPYGLPFDSDELLPIAD